MHDGHQPADFRRTRLILCGRGPQPRTGEFDHAKWPGAARWFGHLRLRDTDPRGDMSVLAAIHVGTPRGSECR